MTKTEQTLVDKGSVLYFQAVLKEKDGNIDDCLDLMEEAANLGNFNALYTVGTWYNNGSHDYEENTEHALKLFEEALLKGHAMAAHEAGIIYETGDGVEKDFSKAFKYFQVSVYLGCRHALLALSRCYQEGIGTDVDKNLSNLLYYRYFNSLEI